MFTKIKHLIIMLTVALMVSTTAVTVSAAAKTVTVTIKDKANHKMAVKVTSGHTLSGSQINSIYSKTRNWKNNLAKASQYKNKPWQRDKIKNAVGVSFPSGWKTKKFTKNTSITVTYRMDKPYIIYRMRDTKTGKILEEYNGRAIEKNQTIPTASIPSKYGYTLVGWTDTPVGKKVTAARTYYVTANMAPKTYKISYSANASGVTGVVSAQDNCLYGKEYTLQQNGYDKPGYVFEGWRGSNDVVYRPGQKVKDLGNITMRAIWRKTASTPEEVKHTITYDYQGGTISGVNPTVYYESDKKQNIINPVKPGYRFLGWIINDENGKSPTAKVTIPHQYGDLKLKAVYAAIKYTITFRMKMDPRYPIGDDNPLHKESLEDLGYDDYITTLPNRYKRLFEITSWRETRSRTDFDINTRLRVRDIFDRCNLDPSITTLYMDANTKRIE